MSSTQPMVLVKQENEEAKTCNKTGVEDVIVEENSDSVNYSDTGSTT